MKGVLEALSANFQALQDFWLQQLVAHPWKLTNTYRTTAYILVGKSLKSK